MNLRTVLCVLFLLQHTTTYILLPLIDDLLAFSNNTKIILAFTCQKRDGLEIIKHYSSSTYQVKVWDVNISEISYPIPPSYVTFLVDGSCPQWNFVLRRANGHALFAYPLKWIIYYSNENLTIDEMLEEFKEFNILVDSDVTLAIPQENSFKLMKIYKTHVNTDYVVENFGIWTKDKGIVAENFEKVTYKRRRNLMGTVLNSTIVLTQNDSIHHLTDKRDIHIDSITKVDYVLVEHIADTINATIKYLIKDTWGYKDNNSKWSGMIGDLVRKEADIGGSALFFTLDRLSIIDYIASPTPTKSHFLFRRPKLSYVSNVFTLPFHMYVWISCLVLFLISAVTMYIVTKWEWKQKKYVQIKNETNETEIRSNLIEVVFEAYAAVCQQGTSTVPISVPGRITLIFLLISFMFLYTSYSANIVALLQSSSNNIQTLKDLLNSRLDFGVHDTVFNHFYFTVATEPVRKALYQQKVAPPGQKPRFYPIEYGIKKLQQGLFAFHVEQGPGYKLIRETFKEDEKCDLFGIQYLQVVDPWLAVQKNLSHKKMIKVGLRLLQENGIQGRENSLIYPKKPPCISGGSSFVSVGLLDCYAAALVLASGLAAALMMLVLEICISNRIQHYIKLRQQRSK